MEKPASAEAGHIESASSLDDTSPPKEFSDEENEVGFSQPQTRGLLRKLDRTLLPFLALLYLLSFLDRSNIGNAKLAGLEKDLNMTGYDYSVSPSELLSSLFYSFADHPAILFSRICRQPSPSFSLSMSQPRSLPTWP